MTTIPARDTLAGIWSFQRDEGLGNTCAICDISLASRFARAGRSDGSARLAVPEEAVQLAGNRPGVKLGITGDGNTASFP